MTDWTMHDLEYWDDRVAGIGVSATGTQYQDLFADGHETHSILTEECDSMSEDAIVQIAVALIGATAAVVAARIARGSQKPLEEERRHEAAGAGKPAIAVCPSSGPAMRT